ncbi:tripartite tricarboxylate transporter permease [Roseomonas chloroacetimidivorans]|uniref:tripartite tricarboxylate transporter permease n=1 Tax=Roseomonas chloroacetimidivorans TaxID=1766656 RepID=UPI003C72E23C
MAGWDVLLGLALGIIVGYTVGSMPGLTSSIGIALMVPFTFSMSPVMSITLLVTLYMATEYAGAIPAILVNTPGVPAAAITALDGYPMRLRGEAGTALTISILSAAFGSIISTLLLIVTATWIASFALAFGPVEYFALALLGLSLVSSLASGSMLKGFIGLFFGLAVGVIGTDPVDGVPRYVLSDDMLSGIPFLPALIGLFALSGVFGMIETAYQRPAPVKRVPGVSGQFSMMRPHLLPLIRSTLIGYIVSVIPGHGATIASMVAYAVQKRLSRNPQSFGQGNPEGLVAAESAANASVPGALAPMLSLGIPGSASTAVLIGALTLHGVQPGPLLFDRHPEIPFSIFISMAVTMPFMVLLGLCGVRLWVLVTQVPKSLIATLVGAMCLLGSYASQNDVFAIWTTVFFGISGYGLKKIGIHPAPIVLALVLGYLTESNLRRALFASNGDWMPFLTHPISLVCLAAAAVTLLLPLIRSAAPGHALDGHGAAHVP